MATTQETLTAVKDALHALMTGGAVAAYTVSGRNIQHFRLDELIRLKENLERELNSGKDTRNYASFEMP